MFDQVINEFNGFHLAVICAAFMAGGLVKGISSFGLPTVSIPLILIVLPLPSAVSVLAVPLILSNMFQMILAGGIKLSIKRHWPLIGSMLIGLPIGVYLLSIVDIRVLTIMLGCVLILVASLELKGVSLSFLKNHEKIWGPVIGAASGVVGGMTSLFGIMPIFFFVSIGLSKERFVSAVSVLLFAGSLVLAISLERSSILGPLEATYGLIGMIPIMFSVWVGGQIRKRVDQVIFRKVILFLILIVGVSMILRSLNAIIQ